jgi:hypothetical protein
MILRCDVMEQQSKKINVLLYCDNSPVAQFRVSHLGAFGIRLESGPVAYPRNSRVEVQFLDLDNDVTNAGDGSRFPAIVTSCSCEGMALAISASDLSIFKSWRYAS